MKKFYVLGFLFSEDFQKVVLIEKQKPDWQKGRINGLGGKIELWDDSPMIAMIREFKEEAGIKITNWVEFCKMINKDWEVYCFWAASDLSEVRTMETEQVKIIDVKNLDSFPVLSNLHFLIPLALDSNKITAEFIYE